MITKIKNLIRKFRKQNPQPFRSMWDSSGNTGNIFVSTEGTSGQIDLINPGDSKSLVGRDGGTAVAEDKRLKRKPVEVVKDIVGDEPVMNLDNLDGQIRTVKRRIKVLREQDIDPIDEIEALSYLKARKYYNKYKKKFLWSVTTQELIDKLLAENQLKIVPFSSCHKVVPTEALDELEKFVNAWEYVSEGKPNIQLIVQMDVEETRKDPILLASAPFGRWHYILGAWDKEVEIVDDLIYKRK